MAFVNERTEDGKWQTIDRERNIVLKKVGAHPDYPTEFEIIIDDKVFFFEAWQKNKPLFDIKKYDIEWNVVSKNIVQQKPELQRIIEEALHAFGSASSTENVATLKVTFPTDL